MYIHVSEIYNRESIEKNGLLPSKIKLPSHINYFKNNNLCTKDGKMIYTWGDCDNNEKFIRDMIYIKVFGHARNDIYENEPPYINFEKLGSSPIYKYDQMIFDVHLIETNDNIPFGGIHLQSSDESIYNTLHMMDDYYAHNNKKLYVSKTMLRTRVVGKAQYYYSNNKINIKVVK